MTMSCTTLVSCFKAFGSSLAYVSDGAESKTTRELLLQRRCVLVPPLHRAEVGNAEPVVALAIDILVREIC